MDDIVKQALRKWPDVPHCFGWLGLDRRGDWYMRDAAVQAQGDFGQAKGVKLMHDKLIAFIGRNYESDAAGCWFFQNGPQRVYVELERTPWVWRLEPSGEVRSHTGMAVDCEQAFTDELGHLYLQSPQGIGLVHSQDMVWAVDWIEQQRWPLHTLDSANLAQHFGFVQSPQHHRAKENRSTPKA